MLPRISAFRMRSCPAQVLFHHTLCLTTSECEVNDYRRDLDKGISEKGFLLLCVNGVNEIGSRF